MGMFRRFTLHLSRNQRRISAFPEADEQRRSVAVRRRYDKFLKDDCIDLLIKSVTKRALVCSYPCLGDLQNFRIQLQRLEELKNRVDKLRLSRDVYEDNSGLVGDVNIENLYIALERDVEALESLEAQLFPLLDNLPNFLSDQVTESTRTVRTKQPVKMNFRVLDYIKLSYINGIIQHSIIGPQSVYFLQQGAELTVAIRRHFIRALQSAGFLQISGIDFVKPYIINACNDPETRKAQSDPMRLSVSNRYKGDHLVGEASIESLVAFIARRSILKSSLPLKIMSSGCNYNPEDGQKNGISCLLVTNEKAEETCQQLGNLVDIVWKCYDQIGLPVRLNYIGAPFLNTLEYERYEFEVYLPSTKEWSVCGHLSNYTDSLASKIGKSGGYYAGGLIYCNKAVINSIIENFQNVRGEVETPRSLKLLTSGSKNDV